ncbi:hypothetical protein RM572_17610 [Streptomyces sp. DSM 42041]|uniref:L,D-transpeptidase n=1 Tax=Streptomyces hazeniae TaxID=3075538 RepID=A0ABU2NWH9_9ACTN|nr:hypothetical protein [Streptomyces sp. DSM 42041]MDT0380573.1 hypothetical protein [Streptomyces sp. DSM 42041]
MTGNSGRSAGSFVAVLTALAFAVVSFLAYQAAAAQDDGRTTPNGPSTGANGSPTPSASALDRKESERALPADSGTGERVVYSLRRDRVWLVGANERVSRTYEVWPGTVDPEPDAYEVTSRTAQVTGTDGVPIENVVIFGYADGTVVGFSAAADGSRPELDPAKKTGGIRERTADGEAMWRFATPGTPVVVVP